MTTATINGNAGGVWVGDMDERFIVK